MMGLMPGTDGAGAARVPLLFLIAETGGGHRRAAQAVGQALELAYPGRFRAVLCDPLGGAGSARLLRWVTGLYGPAVRLAPWLWGAAYHVSNSRPAMAVLRRTLLRPADRPAAAAVAALRPAAIVSFHPLTGMAAVAARDRAAPGAPVVTVVTDLATMHAAWKHAHADLVIAPPGNAPGSIARPGPSSEFRGSGTASAGDRGTLTGRGAGASVRWAAAGLPVTRGFWAGPALPRERARLRRSLGLPEQGFVVLLAGGAEGGGGMARRAAAILRGHAGVGVVAACGRNRRLRRRLDRLAARSGGRLTVLGFTRDMARWLRCCDVLATKAGPGTIAEAACCGAPLLLTSHLPGQEKGNTEYVTAARAGRRVRGVRRLVAEVGRLRADQAAVEAMRVAAARLGQPAAAADIAGLIAGLVAAGPFPQAAPRLAAGLGTRLPAGPETGSPAGPETRPSAGPGARPAAGPGMGQREGVSLGTG
jgi:1,2-diacylglycerol 3-beta-galactosyltransferase